MSLRESLYLRYISTVRLIIRRTARIGVAVFVVLLAVTISTAAEKTHKYEARAVRVKNKSATMYAHKNYYITLVSRPVGKEGLPEVIKLDDKITVEGRSLTVKHIFVDEILEDMQWAGKVLGRKGDVTCTIVERLQDLPHVDEKQWRDRLWIHVTECEPFQDVAQLSDSPQVSAQDLTCKDYGRFEQSQKISLTYGYLEGVQAALDKEVADMLVPPSNPQHPIWWVLPRGIDKDLVTGLRQNLEQYCKSSENQQKRLLDAFLSIAYQKGGWPTLGISLEKEKTDPWRNILGGKESSVSCSAYNMSPVKTRQAIIDGYYLGTQAFKVILKSSVDIGMVWPSKLAPQQVREETDKRCQQEKGATLREVLWISTVELGVQNR